MVVPYTAGGPADLLVRALGQKLTDAWGQQVIVENKPGANEIIAAQEVAHAPADGYNWLLASDAVYALNPYLYRKLPYDTAKDFAPVSRHVQAGKMKGLAVSGAHRHPLIPDVPTFAEAGMRDFDASFYFALAAPAGTPRDVVGKLAAESAKIVNTAQFKERLSTLGFEPVG